MTDNVAAIARQIMWNRLISVVEEQAQTLLRTAFSPIVRESGDLSAGVFDTRGRMLAQAVTAGGATYALLDLVMDVPEPTAIRWVILGGVAAIAALMAIELTSKAPRTVEMAVHEMTRGAYATRFWWGGVVLGLVAPAVLVIIALAGDIDGAALPALAGISALVGLFAYEDAFVRAGQSVPLS